MCFTQPRVPDAPPVPSAESQAAKSRRANEIVQEQQQQGRAATVLTPLNNNAFGENVRRTRIGGV